MATVVSDSSEITVPVSSEPTVTGDRNADGIGQEAEGRNLCQHFLLGRCHFGDRCRLSHSSPASAITETLMKEPEWEDQHKTPKKICSSEKRGKTKENQETHKKPRMRTADDVINRILWDDSVDPADFVVGHLDRFLGLLERPFSEFSWDISVTECDFTEELALPRHRIQYFSYRGERVWDRDSRTDRVFGSTGQTLLPPFGGVVKQQEHVTQDAQSNNLKAAEDHVPPEDCVEKIARPTVCINEHRPLDDPGGPGMRSDFSSDEAEAVEDLSLDSLTQDLSVSENHEATNAGEQAEWKGSWDGYEDREHLSWAITSPQKQEHRHVGGKRKPTHFIAFRVDSPAATHAFQRVQGKVLSMLPESGPHWASLPTLHVTLCLLVLSGPAEVSEAAELLQKVVRNLHKPPVSVSFSPKLKHFGGKVLYLAPRPLSEIQALNAPLQQAYREKGWLHRHSRSPNYHLTLAKVDGGDRPFEGAGTIKLGKDINFGKLEVKKLHLCVNGRPRTEGGFYESVCATTIPDV
ncbi:leukocyte receptor cluster member 9 isoform X2 [Denticeps clupeoides]|uniref:C3H1-type domain-containing protein n=1 Tax=Denticeps clupeoides TaxID=299321 RepID=A0AAY4A8H6_9TELE|nr:leukocyte receptor cluster member 9 isoform X2 [Denticeps clupeoides]